MADKINWLQYEFSICHPQSTWNDVAGLYMFCGINQANQWVPLYIGQASSLAERLANHEQWPKAASIGASHIHARVEPLQSQRDAIERYLIQQLQPRLNSQLR